MALVAILFTVAGRVTDITSSSPSVSSAPVAETNAGYLRPPVLLSTVPSVLARHVAEAQATAAPSATAVAAAAPTTAATPEPTPEPLPAYFTYTVQPGDSVSSIAARYGVNEDYLLWNNPHLSTDPDLLVIGGTLLIPSTNGLVYNVTLGDTLAGIAGYYGINVDDIIGFAPNGVSTPDTVVEGMVLVLPGAQLPQPIATPEPEPEPVYEPVPQPVAVDPEPTYNPPPAAPSSGFIWPFYAAISTYFSGGHRGIDIDGFGQYGATIVAAGSGTVVLTAYDSYGYGYHVIIQHDDGSRTLYAHLSDIWVGQGQYVGQGEGIGALGSTGYSTGPHLHFEIYIGGGAVDPLAYLP